MKILITGGAGFIGSNLARFLLDAGHKVVILDTGWACGYENAPLGAALIKGGIEIRTNPAMVGCDAVVHLAAQTSVVESKSEPRRNAYANVMGTITMLDAARNANPDMRVIVASSCAAGAGKAASPYGASKVANEAYCQAYHESYGLNTTAIRFANVYGNLSAHKDSVISLWCRGIAERTLKAFTIFGDGEQTRDFIHVHDLCRAISDIIHIDTIGGEAIEVGTGGSITMNMLCDVFNSVSGLKLPRHHKGPRSGELRHSTADTSHIAGLSGWASDVHIERGVAETLAWFQAIRGITPGFDAAK